MPSHPTQTNTSRREITICLRWPPTPGRLEAHKPYHGVACGAFLLQDRHDNHRTVQRHSNNFCILQNVKGAYRPVNWFWDFSGKIFLFLDRVVPGIRLPACGRPLEGPITPWVPCIRTARTRSVAFPRRSTRAFAIFCQQTVADWTIGSGVEMNGRWKSG